MADHPTQEKLCHDIQDQYAHRIGFLPTDIMKTSPYLPKVFESRLDNTTHHNNTVPFLSEIPIKILINNFEYGPDLPDRSKPGAVVPKALVNVSNRYS